MDVMSFLLRVLINAAAIWLAAQILPGLEVVGGDDTASRVLVFLVLALVFGIVNAIIKPVVKLIALPLYILTLGLFTLVVNALMLMLTGWLSELTDYGLRIDNFGTAVLGGLSISIASFLLSLVLHGSRDKD